MNWMQKLANTVGINLGKYPEKVRSYLFNLAANSETRQQEMSTYEPNWNNIAQLLQTIEYSNPQGALAALQSGDWNQIWNVRKSLSDIGIRYNDPRHQSLEQLIDEIRNVADKSSTYTYTTQDAEQDITRIIQETTANIEKVKNIVQSAISNIENWQGSPVVITNPRPSSDGNNDLWHEAADIFSVQVGNATKWGGETDFTFFFSEDKFEIDDVLEGGDTDFFNENSPGIAHDYFALVQELKNPGQNKSNKIITLYTARPVKNRALFENATTLIPNIFLTTSYNFAESFGLDYSEHRDIWKIRIESRYLVNTFSSPEMKHYQVRPGENAPVRSIQLIQAGQ